MGESSPTTTEPHESSVPTVPLDASILSAIEATVAERCCDIEEQLRLALARLEELEEKQATDRVTVVVFSGDMDKLMGAFIIATGAAALGMQVSMFFTFWGLSALRDHRSFRGKKLTHKMISAVLPGGPQSVPTSKLNFMGLGPKFFQRLMKKHNVATLPELIELAREFDVKMTSCQMSQDLLGIRNDELIAGVEHGGVATFLEDASDSRVTLFI